MNSNINEIKLHINPICHGNHDNIWFNIHYGKSRIKVCGFYNSEEAYITKANLKNIDKDTLYNKLKDTLGWEFDFKLMTPRKRAFSRNIKNTQELLDWIRVTKNNRNEREVNA